MDRFRPPPVSAVGPAPCKRSDGCGVRPDRADAAAGETGWAAPNDVVARGGERDFLPVADRLPRRGLLAASPSRDRIDGLLAIDWRMLPKELPPRSTVYDYFRRFWQVGIWQHIWMTLVMAGREQAGKEASPTAAIIDSQSVKTTESGGIRGDDAGKKVPSGACWPRRLRRSDRSPADDRWPQAPSAHRHARSAARPGGACRRHPGSRRPSPGLPPHPPPLPMAHPARRRRRLSGRPGRLRRRARTAPPRDRQAAAQCRGLPPAAATPAAVC